MKKNIFERGDLADHTEGGEEEEEEEEEGNKNMWGVTRQRLRLL